jgi:hypothetical protein
MSVNSELVNEELLSKPHRNGFTTMSERINILYILLNVKMKTGALDLGAFTSSFWVTDSSSFPSYHFVPQLLGKNT